MNFSHQCNISLNKSWQDCRFIDYVQCAILNYHLQSLLFHIIKVSNISKKNNKIIPIKKHVPKSPNSVRKTRNLNIIFIFGLVNKGSSLKDKSWSDGGFNRRMEQERHNNRMRAQREEKQKAWDARQEIDRKRKLPSRKRSLYFELKPLK